MKKRIFSLLITIFISNLTLAQNPKFKRANRLLSHFEKDYSSHKTDSIVQFDLSSRAKKILTFKREIATKGIKPHTGKYAPIRLSKYSSLPKLKESNASFLFRTHHLVDSMQQYPITAVAKTLQYRKGDRTRGCTATFVSENFLITAAHCFYDNSKGYPDKIELKIMYDNGIAERIVNVKKVYHKKHYREGVPFDANSYDIGLIEIEEPLGKELGYIGLLSQVELDKKFNSWQKMYSFSYPHTSSAELDELEMKSKKFDASKRKKYVEKIQKSRLLTPDFSNRNQYFEVLNIFLDNQKNYKYIIPYSIPGKSVSARISEDFYLYGVRSFYLNNAKISIDVQPRNEILNSFIKIIKGN